MQHFGFHPIVSEWFRQKFETPTPPQEQGWPAISSGSHTLIAAPTGTGKTLSAFLASLNELFSAGLDGKLSDEVQIIYVTPLKALSNDIHKNLEIPLQELRERFKNETGRDIEVRAAVRTGDTPSSKRQAIQKKPPHILVTTPESFYLLLTSISGRKILSTVKSIIVDEIHALVGNRRGSHLSLSIERLERLINRPLQRIGLSATQKPIDEVARFLLGNRNIDKDGKPRCKIIDVGHVRKLDLEIVLPGSPLEAVMSTEVWSEVYEKLCELILSHRTTLVFVNTRRLAERVSHQLAERLGKENVTAHHGSLSAKLRLEAERRLKAGELKALVATASLELGIDIGSVDLVCQIGTTRSISTCLQRVGRAEHRRGGIPKGRLFPLTRDELVECAATIRCIRNGELDSIEIPAKPIDVLSQQIVACAGSHEWNEDDLFSMVTSAYPYRSLSRQEYDEIIQMLSTGFTTKKGRRAALIYYDAVNHRIRGRKGSRLIALTSGGAIPDNAEYRVIVEPGETFIGTVNEDFAVESLVGDIFQLGNASWKIIQVNSGKIRVEDAKGQPPGIPFWLGEAPGRTRELSWAVSQLREEAEKVMRRSEKQGTDTASLLSQWFQENLRLTPAGGDQLAIYFLSSFKTLGCLPSENKLIIERFFDESGGMQLVLHSCFGSRINRAWGLALRKRFCRSFNFELQSAATDDAIVLSLGTQHSFPLEEVFHYLKSQSVRELLIQAVLDHPMFTIRWRWNASRSLALPRQRGGQRVPPPLQRMEAENLMAAVFPDQLACLENIVGDRVVPDHPLIKQTIEDCLTEAMDIEGLENILKRIENHEIECIALDLPEPSTFSHEILNARVYAFLDNAPLEERRTQAVFTRRASDTPLKDGMGILDPAAIDTVCRDAWPKATMVDELHEYLLLMGVMTDEELERCNPEKWKDWTHQLVSEHRITKGSADIPFWTTAERLTHVQLIYPSFKPSSSIQEIRTKTLDEASALKELIRGRMETIGPVTTDELSVYYRISASQIEAALLGLESEGFILRGKFRQGVRVIEWCDRRLLSRIHRLTINRLRSEIQPVTIEGYQEFLFHWQHTTPETQMEGPEGVDKILSQLDGIEVAAGAWEPSVLSSRVRNYSAQWLDRLCLMGKFGWGRISINSSNQKRGSSPVRSTPISIFVRQHLNDWLALSQTQRIREFDSDTDIVLHTISKHGAMFFAEISHQAHLLPSSVEQAIAELVMNGLGTSDSFEGLRSLLVPQEKRHSFGSGLSRRRRLKAITSIEHAGRWSLLRKPMGSTDKQESIPESSIEKFAEQLLQRYGVVFRRLLDREAFQLPWYEIVRVYRRWEAQGRIRGGYFVSGVSGEQFALPESIGSLRKFRNTEKAPDGDGQSLITISAADPLNLTGILFPGHRVPSVQSNRLLFKGGRLVATLEAGTIRFLQETNNQTESFEVERRLRVGKLPAALRPYYA